ncbi:MAG: hypothetical protein HY047_17170 [Acidobacteria bacterium]|nr:hypothetical protein [Acidobacteriota bacterium]
MIIPFTRRGLPGLVAIVAAIGGALAAWHYARLGLTLSHYDARGRRHFLDGYARVCEGAGLALYRRAEG